MSNETKKGRPGFDYSVGVDNHNLLPGEVQLAIVGKNSYWARYGQRVGPVLHESGFDPSQDMIPSGYGWKSLVDELRASDLTKPDQKYWMPVWYYLLEECK